MSESHPTATLLTTGVKLSRAQSPAGLQEAKEVESVPYKQAVGMLIYLACLTRPDILHVVHTVSQFMESYGREHWGQVK